MGHDRASVIFLNGPSSVGKSSIAKLLQDLLLPTPFLHIGIDYLIDMMPESMNSWSGERREEGFWWKIGEDEDKQVIANLEAGSYAKKVSHSLIGIALSLLADGHNLIIDEICLLPKSFSNWKVSLADYRVFYVGLMANTEILVSRERERKDRMIGSARAQNLTVHLGNEYDLSLNTDLLSPSECAKTILAQIGQEFKTPCQ